MIRVVIEVKLFLRVKWKYFLEYINQSMLLTYTQEPSAVAEWFKALSNISQMINSRLSRCCTAGGPVFRYYRVVPIGVVL